MRTGPSDARDLRLTQARIDAWREHYRTLIATGKQGHWRKWIDTDRQCDSVANYLRGRVDDVPTQFLEWPAGWFVKLANGRVVFVSLQFTYACVRFGGHVDIAWACAEGPDRPKVSDWIAGLVCAVLILVGIYGWAVFP